MFIDLHDTSGKIQIFSHKDHLPAEQLAVVKLLDLGDLIGVEGIVRRTPRGELTINSTKITVLAKASAAAAREISRPRRHRDCAIASAISI